MVCQRCRAQLVCETFDDSNIETNTLYSATRCINCGYIEDAVMRANRFRPSVKMPVILPGRVRRGDLERIKVRSEEYALIR